MKRKQIYHVLIQNMFCWVCNLLRVRYVQTNHNIEVAIHVLGIQNIALYIYIYIYIYKHVCAPLFLLSDFQLQTRVLQEKNTTYQILEGEQF